MNFLKLLTDKFKKPEPKPTTRQVNAQKKAEVVEKVDKFIQDHNPVRGKWKLNDVHKEFVCRLVGYQFSDNEVVKELEISYGIKVTPSNIQLNYRGNKKYAPTIEKYKQEYLSRYDDVPGFHKKVRLNRMEKAYTKADEKGDLKSIVSITEHQRKEVEGAGDTSLTLVSNRYYNMTDAELDKRQKEIIEQLKKEGALDAVRRIESETGESGKDNGGKDV